MKPNLQRGYPSENKQLTLEFFTMRISVRLSDKYKVTQNKISYVKNCHQWGLNSQPPDHQFHALSTEISHYLFWVWIIKAFIKSYSIDSKNKQNPTCEMVHETKERSLQKSPTFSSLAQLAEHETDAQRSWVQTPMGKIFYIFFFCGMIWRLWV